MSIHPPKFITSSEGLGVGTAKSMHTASGDIGISTEIWQEMSEPWSESGVIIAEPGYKWVAKWEAGKPFVIVKFYNTVDKLVGIYCEVTRPVRRTKEDFEFDDLYLDVWQTGDQKPVILDQDELEEAFESGLISAEDVRLANDTADYLVKELENNPQFTKF